MDKNPRHSKVSAGDFSMGRFARCCASLRQCAGGERVGEQTACARQEPVQGRVFHLLRQLLWKVEVPLRYGLHQSGTEKSPAFQSECRGFFDGAVCPVLCLLAAERWKQAGR